LHVAFWAIFLSNATQVPCIENDLIWYEEFLDYKIVIGTTNSDQEAIEKNKQILWWSFWPIITKNGILLKNSWKNVDTAAVYHNASTRFTDGGQFGLGENL
jgi:glutamate-5-semialdehyde dehydrogenase